MSGSKSLRLPMKRTGRTIEYHAWVANCCVPRVSPPSCESSKPDRSGSDCSEPRLWPEVTSDLGLPRGRGEGRIRPIRGTASADRELQQIGAIYTSSDRRSQRLSPNPDVRSVMETNTPIETSSHDPHRTTRIRSCRSAF
eukprot:scaffold128_cov328-Pavlova_lutheri.AAC.54